MTAESHSLVFQRPALFYSVFGCSVSMEAFSINNLIPPKTQKVWMYEQFFFWTTHDTMKIYQNIYKRCGCQLEAVFLSNQSLMYHSVLHKSSVYPNIDDSWQFFSCPQLLYRSVNINQCYNPNFGNVVGRFLSLNKMKTYSVTIETSVPWDMGTSTSSKMR